MSKSKTSPRKFAEKIALLNKKEAEATAEFVRIIKEVEETTRAPPIWQQQQQQQQHLHHYNAVQQASPQQLQQQVPIRQQLPIRSSSVSDPNRVHYPRLSSLSPHNFTPHNVPLFNAHDHHHASPMPLHNNDTIGGDMNRLHPQQQQHYAHNQLDNLHIANNMTTSPVEVPNIAIFPTDDERFAQDGYSPVQYSPQNHHPHHPHHHHHQPPPPAPASSLNQCSGFGEPSGSSNNMLNFSYNPRNTCSMLPTISAARSMPNIADLGLSTPPAGSPGKNMSPTQQIVYSPQHIAGIDSSNNTSNSSEYMSNYNNASHPEQQQHTCMADQQVRSEDQSQDYCNYQAHSSPMSCSATTSPNASHHINNCDDATQSNFNDWQHTSSMNTSPELHQPQYQPPAQQHHSPSSSSTIARPETSGALKIDHYYQPIQQNSQQQQLQQQQLLEPGPPIVRANSTSMVMEDWSGGRKSLETPRISNHLSKSSEADCGYLGGCQNNNTFFYSKDPR